MHSAGIVVQVIDDEQDDGAVLFVNFTVEPIKPAIPIMGDARGFDLDRDPAGTPQDVSEFDDPLPLPREIHRKVEIDDSAV